MKLPASATLLPMPLFRNICERYGNPEIATLEDYRTLATDRVFFHFDNAIWELDDKGKLEIVAITDATA